MATQALYLRYRPRTFEEVVGQEPVTRTLRNALSKDRFRHAYLFTGPRGTGKTSTARILAKAVNCTGPESARPCNECAICNAVNDGRLMDLIEIDAASNRGIDEIRDIREKVSFRPSQARNKVYVLDEAHMLTGEAFNALLKTLEEPPPHVVFVLVTTEPHKIPATITSRCQRFDFRRISLDAIVGRLTFIAEREGLRVEPAALELIARQSTGAMRDAISLLDQLTSYGEEIRLDQVQMVLGTITSEAATALVLCLAEADVAGGLDLINRAVAEGTDPRQMAREIVECLRGILLIQAGTGSRLLNATAEQASRMEAMAARLPNMRVLRAIRLFNDAATSLRRGLESIPQLPLEMALVESLQPADLPIAPPPEQASSPRGTHLPDRDSEPQLAPRRTAELPERVFAPETGLTASEPLARPVTEQAAPGARAPASIPAPVLLTLDQVALDWKRVLQAVRLRNPTTQGVLNSGCRPVEVIGSELVITLPSAMLQQKLRDPQRTVEIEEAVSQVFGTKCTVKLILESAYIPREQAAPSVPAPDPAASTANPADGPNAVPPAGEGVPVPLAEWATERGGTVRLVP
jgi:DNA polymerase-3 subunit gamma/tau